ncbi:hypothetical protein ACFO5X_11485 [Seohaeicola nanhaiensis]|uniref:DUF4384 domain-containing protein n=1 Tax=Seohaeicola nanhaiensis TaxID=1387282 RepID=A0ABV9KH40_9RHOB
MSAARWAAGLAISALVHVGGYGALALAVKPDPVEEQPLPPSKLDVQAYQLDRTVAQEARPDAEAAAEAQAEGASLAQGAIPHSRARVTEARAEPVAPGRPEADRLTAEAVTVPQLEAARPQADAAATAQAAPTVAVSAPVSALPVQTAVAEARPAVAAQVIPAVLRAEAAPAKVLPAAAETALRVAAAVQPAAPIAAAQATPVALAPDAPEAAPVATVAPDAAALPDTPATGQLVAEAAANATPTEAAAPLGEPVKATLAFPTGDGEVDPVSLAAFQSFMKPGDVSAEGDPLRDGVSALLAQVPCSRLQVAFDPDTATLQINGHIPENDLRAPVLAALQAQMGEDIRVSDNILILPRPQCGALSGIGDVGLPQSNDQSTNPLLIGEASQARVLDFVKDQRLWFDLTAPEYDAYVYVDFFDAGGNVIHLAPNEQVPLNLATRDEALRVGTRSDDDRGLKIVIGPPYGQEIAVAFAASEPLYEGLRPLMEPAAPYLAYLKERVAEKRAEHADFKGEWVYFFVTTAER